MKGGFIVRKILIIIMIFGLILINIHSLAQDDNLMGFRFDPLVVEQTVLPGQKLNYQINIDNINRFKSITLEFSVADIIEDKTGTYVLKPPNSTPYTIADKVSFSQNEITIPPGNTETLEVTIDIPRGSKGGLYGAVVLSTVNKDEDIDEEAFAITNFQFVGASFLELIVSRNAAYKEAHITNFYVQNSEQIADLNEKIGDKGLVFSASVLNIGDIHIVTKGELIIRNIDGRTIARYPLGGGRGVIIPDSEVELRSIIAKKNLPPGEYLARTVINYGGHRPLVSETNFSINENVVKSRDQSTELAKFIIEPEVVEMNFPPGSFKTSIIELTNRENKNILVNSNILPLKFDINGNLVRISERFDAIDEKSNYLDWFQVSPNSFELKPNQSKRVRLSVRSPRDSKGAYYADIIFSAQIGESLSERGVNVFAYAGEDINKNISIDLNKINQDIQNNNLDMELIVENKGSIHINPEIEIKLNKLIPQKIETDGTIIGAHSEEIISHKFSKYENPILPDQQRIFQSIFPISLEEGEYELLIRADYGAEEAYINRTKFKIKGGKKDV